MKTQSLIFFVFLLALFCINLIPTNDPDLWMHLRVGKEIFRSGIPFIDIFSYTMPGRPWVAHEWFSEMIMFFIYDHATESGLMIFFAGLSVVSFLLIYLSSSRGYVALLLTEWGAIISRLVWGSRPQVFNLLMLALFLFTFEKVRRKEWGPRSFLGLSGLLILWQNLHSGFLLGLVVMAVVWLGEAWDSKFRESIKDERSFSPQSRQYLLGAVFLGFLSCGFNPHGYHILIYPFETLGSPAQQNFIMEWLSPDFHGAAVRPFLAYLPLAIASFCWKRKPVRTSELVLLLGSLAAGFLSVRHIPFFIFVSVPMVIRNFTQNAGLRISFEGVQAPQIQKIFNAMLAGIFFAAAVLWVLTMIRDNPQKIEKNFPIKAIQFLEHENPAHKNLFHVSHWGGILMLHDIPVFIDGRPDFYGDDFFLQYLKMVSLEKDWEKQSRTFLFEYVLFPSDYMLSHFLEGEPAWKMVYQDKVAKVFKRTAAY